MQDELDFWHALDAFLGHHSTLDELFRWLVDHVQETEHDESVREPADRAWILISEFDLGHRSEESVREELRALRVAA